MEEKVIYAALFVVLIAVLIGPKGWKIIHCKYFHPRTTWGIHGNGRWCPVCEKWRGISALTDR
jgi:hypothetical protein